jgi:hypothetical protein
MYLQSMSIKVNRALIVGLQEQLPHPFVVLLALRTWHIAGLNPKTHVHCFSVATLVTLYTIGFLLNLESSFCIYSLCNMFIIVSMWDVDFMF